MHHAHAAPAAAAGGFDDDRVADAARNLDDLGRVVRQRAFHARHARHTGFFIAILAETLSPIRRMVSARGPMNTKPHFRRVRKSRRFPTGSRSRDGWLSIGDFRRADDGGDVQVAQIGGRGPMQTDSSASFTYWHRIRSECTTTV